MIKKIQHYVYIKNLDSFVSKNARDEDGILRNKKRNICSNCLHGYSSSKLLNEHIENGCNLFEPTRIEMPKMKNNEIPTIKFENYTRKFKSPVVIYADFETFIKKTDNEHNELESSKTKLAELPPCGFSFNIGSDYPELSLGMELYRGDNTIDEFLTRLLKHGDKIRQVLDNVVKMESPQQQKEFDNCKVCNICEKPILKNQIKARDHCHVSGLYRGCCHQSCNVNFNNKNFQVPVYFHNRKGFDGHCIMQGLKKRNFSNIQITAQNFEKYMTFSFEDFRFLDSFAFMSSSLDTLSKNLIKDGKHNFKHTLNNNLLNNEQKDILLKKGVYPYEYIDCFKKFEESQLPPIEKFYSSLSESNITQEEYEHAKKYRVYSVLKILESITIYTLKLMYYYELMFLKHSVKLQ